MKYKALLFSLFATANLFAQHPAGLLFLIDWYKQQQFYLFSVKSMLTRRNWMIHKEWEVK